MTEDDLSPRQRALAGEFGKEGHSVEDAIQMAHDAGDPVVITTPAQPVRMREALAALYEWYDRDGSVGGAADVFEANRAVLAAQPPAAPVETIDSVPSCGQENDYRRASPQRCSAVWCPGCSRDVDGVCHHFNCAIGPNGLAAQARSSAGSARELPRYVSGAAREAAQDALNDLETNTRFDSDIYTLAQHMMAFASLMNAVPQRGQD